VPSTSSKTRAAELQQLTAQHDRVAGLIAGGDGEGAAAAISAHIRGFYPRLLAVPDEQQ
jgi:DNA-binding GntR family transcriptional regulator